MAEAFAGSTTPAPSLDDKYTLSSGRVYLTGYQALVRLLLIQKADRKSTRLNSSH